MNKTFITLLAFVCGGGVGYLVSKKLLEEKYAQITQEEIDSVKEYYSTKASHVITGGGSGLGGTNLGNGGSGCTDTPDPSDKDRTNKMPLVRNSINDAGPVTRTVTSYNEMAKEKMKSDLGFGGAEPNDESEEEPYVDAAGFYEGDHIDYGGERDLSDVDRSAPYVISDREFTDEFPHHDKVSLYYYTHDDVLVDEGERFMEEIDDTVGWDVFKVLEMQSSAWVRNEPLGIDYEICAVRGSFAALSNGVGVTPALSPRERHDRSMKRRHHDDE